ncbi:MAG: SDR family oxidoreductase [Phycisphaeraceae bacterium]|nr:SDR family oxidoreductase [Phycisphaeraceae bacterium]
MSIDLSGKTVVVTGATGELGRVMSRTLAKAGADVAVHCHANRAKADALAKELRDMGRRALVVQADVADHDSVFAMRDAVVKELGQPHVIVNNAVSQYAWTTVLEQNEADYESQFRTCVMQSVLMAKAFVPAMVERKWGRVIAINTECSMQCWPNQSAYVSGKRGMDGVLRVLAREVGPSGVTVNQVAPGWTISENRGGDDTPQWYLDRVALGRRGFDQEIANAVAFLASDLSSFITGAYVPVCGGNVMPAI